MSFEDMSELNYLRALVPVMRSLGVREAFGVILGPEPEQPKEPMVLDANPVANAAAIQEEAERASKAAEEWLRKQEDRVRYAASEGYEP